jgi:hypothetical protein
VQDIACRAAAHCTNSGQGDEANELLCGSAGFRAARRLTGFGFPRNIIRIRTIWVAVAIRRIAPDIGLQGFT